MMKEFTLRSLGSVEADGKGFYLQVNEEHRKALTGLEGYSHVQVYWWANLTDSDELREILVSPKPYKKGPDEIGIFATRSPVRPNPLAMTVVPLLEVDREKGRLGIAFIDAEPGTPLLDIKPYYGMERVRDYRIPQWCSHWPQWYEDAGVFDWAGEFENAR